MRFYIFAIFVFCSVSYTWRMNTIELTGVVEIMHLFHDNGIVFACADYSEECARNNGILAVDVDKNEELWYYEIESEDCIDPGKPYYITYHDNRIYAAVSYLGILCLDAQSGEEEFLWEQEGYVHSSIIQDNGYLYAATFSKIVKLDACTGELIWELPIQRENSDIPLNLCDIYLDKGKLIAGFIQPAIFCVDPSTGEIVWRNEDIPEWRGHSYSGACYVSDNLVFAAAQSEDIIVLDSADGSIQSYFESSRCLECDDSGIYLTLRENGENYICVLDPVTGNILIRATMDSATDISNIEILDDLLCFCDEGGQLCILPGNDIADISGCGYRKNVSAEAVSVAVYGDRIFAISDDGIVFSVNSQLEDELEIETGYELESPQLFYDSRCIIPSGNRLLVLEY